MPIRQPSRQPGTRSNRIIVENLVSSSTIDDVSIIQSFSLEVEELTLSTSIEDGRVTTFLQGEDMISSSVLENADITQKHLFGIEEMLSQTTLEISAITQTHTLNAQDLVSSTTIGNLDIKLVPSEPSNLVVSRSTDYLSTSLSWDAVSQADIYGIYRADDEQSAYTQIDTTANTSYTDSHGNKKKNYAYKVSAFILSTEGRKTIGQHTAGSESSIPL